MSTLGAEAEKCKKLYEVFLACKKEWDRERMGYK